MVDSGTTISLSKIRDTINNEHEINIVNIGGKTFLAEHFQKRLSSDLQNGQINQFLLFHFSSSISLENIVQKLHLPSMTKTVAEKL